MVSPVPTRLLLIVLALLGGDYLLWSWSADGTGGTLALISGIALVPLILTALWLSALGVARMLIRRPMRASTSGRQGEGARGGSSRLAPGDGSTPDGETMTSRSDRSSEKIAA